MTPIVTSLIHAVVRTDDGRLVHRPAIVVAVGPDTVACHVFANPISDGLDGMGFREALPFDPTTFAENSWHWPEPA